MCKVQVGHYAVCILVDGDSLEDITLLQNHNKLNVICINGRVQKAGRRKYVQPPVAGQDNNVYVIVPDKEYPTVNKKEMHIRPSCTEGRSGHFCAGLV
jgi:hypothetical protein